MSNLDETDLSWDHPGEASLWIGRFESEEHLNSYLEFCYGDDDETIKPPFCKDFAIYHFDEDFREAYIVEESSNNLADLLSGCSYDEELIQQFIDAGELEEAMNTVILLFNYKYHGRCKEIRSDGYSLRYIGNVRYE
ncbi:immunity 22 family protein [Paenibacillus turpanensis]|uniref:immunity 22 family protein n=1 Tax=Paenibacillus turpanensis TaxID=2689078 RepID=UPI00140B6E95|nr:immunity 22 family protein [Paenibacillus turpanensis]